MPLLDSMTSNFAKPSGIGMLVLSFVFGLVSLRWSQSVQDIVPEPYLVCIDSKLSLERY